MKTNFIKLFHYFGKNRLYLRTLNALFRSTGRGLIKYGIAMFHLTLQRLTGRRVNLIVKLMFKMKRIHDSQGPTGLVKYLKTAVVCIQKSLGSDIVSNPRKIGKVGIALNRQGLPRIIPALLRKDIRRGNHKMVKFLLTILNFYRNLSCFNTLNMGTISSPYTGVEGAVESLQQYVIPFCNSFVFRYISKGAVHDKVQNKVRIFPILKGAPGLIGLAVAGAGVVNYSSHPIHMIHSMRALKNFKFKIFGSQVSHWDNLRAMAKYYAMYPILDLMDHAERFSVGPCRKVIAKLQIKIEAAGKVRVFAMVDPWTQWVLYPIQEVMFEIVKFHDNVDGTFDQLKPLWRLIESKPKGLFSLDLTAATDRLPLSLQKSLMSQIFGAEFATMWALCLVERDYVFNPMFNPEFKSAAGPYRYAVGQPMGARSS